MKKLAAVSSASVLALGAMLTALPAAAAETGELWEVSTAMNIPGMPAGMGNRTARVCRDKNESPAGGRNDCKVSDVKRSGLTETMTMTCPDATMTVEMTYNAARTEYKSTMRMKSKDGDMTMTSNGRKVGTCDPAVARAEQQQKVDDAKARGKAAQAQVAGQLAQSRQQRLEATKTGCTEAVTKMDFRPMAGVFCYGERAKGEMHCTKQGRELMAKDPHAKDVLEVPAEARTYCDAKRAEFCSKLQTPAGFQLAEQSEENRNQSGEDSEGRRQRPPLAKRIPQASAFCGVKNETIAAGLCSKAIETDAWGFLHQNCPADAKAQSAKLCPRALEKEAYFFLGTYCPAQAKPLYAQNCAGRDYTSLYEKKDKKVFRICHGIGLALTGNEQPAESRPAAADKNSAVDSATQGVQQGINKLKGLFGR